MGQSQKANRRVVLAARPTGEPTPANFRLEEKPIPSPKDGEVLLRTVWLSLDPYMRIRMNEGFTYAPSADVDGVMVGETVARVVESKNPSYRVGDLIVSKHGWQDYAVSDGTGLMKLPSDMKDTSRALGTLGMPGFSAYMGLLTIGMPKPGETVVVGAATGAVGAVVGQIAKLKGCRAVGVAGGAKKCEFAVKELGFDACVDHYSNDLPALLKAACPKGVDIYFESVGGKTFDAVRPLLNLFARIPLCGLIAHYSSTDLFAGNNQLPLFFIEALIKRLRIEGFIIYDLYAEHFDKFLKEMSGWVASGKIKIHEHVIEGLENAPQGLIGLLDGKNFGKAVVNVGAP
jgi:NADPH-dependent curcumin reductase CurA